jgi:DNA invertase Pin-like site-specific DNA recombinase
MQFEYIRCCPVASLDSIPRPGRVMRKKEGRKPGPKKRIDPKRVRALRKKGRLIRKIMQEVGASKATVYRALRDA